MRQLISNLVLGLGLLLSLAVFASLLKSLYWGFDLLTHFYLQYGVLLLVAFLLVLLFGTKKAKGLSLLLIPALAIVLINLAPFFIPQTSETSNTTSLKAISLNLYLHNPNAQGVVAYLKEQDADLILLTEAVPEMMQVLKTELGSIYPHIQDSSRRGAFGIALLSKQPLDVAQTFDLRSNTSRRPGQSIYAVVDGVHIVGMHPLPPTAGRYAELRDTELAGLHSFVEGLLRNDANSPIILLGDFNASPWSAPIEKLIKKTPIKHGSVSKGLWPTWRLFGKGPIIFGAPIDHIFVSENITTVSYKTKIIEGSDHSAVVADLVIP